MSLCNYLLFVFEKNLINNEDGLELFYTSFQEAALNFDLVEKMR